MRKRYLIIGFIVILIVIVAATLVLAAPSFAGKLEEAIAKTPVGDRPGYDPSRRPQGLHGDSRSAPSFLPVLHPVGHLGRLDLLLGGRLRRHHGRGGPHHRLRAVGLWQESSRKPVPP